MNIQFVIIGLISYNYIVMETTDVNLTREAIIDEPRVVLTLIKEGTAHAPFTEKQKAYDNAKNLVFGSLSELTKDRVRDLLTTKKAEVEEAIQTSPLRAATDRNGFTLGNLRDMSDIAIQELDGTLHANTVLKRVLEIETDERERQVMSEAKDNVREGLVVNKDGDIYIQSFPSQNKKDIASSEAQNMKTNFLKAKERLQNFASSLK